jgi:hypothetical protein
MTRESHFTNDSDKPDYCPLPKSHRRLSDSHLLWHQALEAYHDPDKFRANLNATIEALRNVTFVLQSEKGAFPGFKEWYEPWQARLKADPSSKWLQSARTTVVHQGELDSHSTAEVRLVTWRDEVIANLRVAVTEPSSSILQDPQVAEFVAKCKEGMKIGNDAAIAIERRWCATTLGDSEILDALARAYGLLSALILDAHVHLNKTGCIPNENHHPDFQSAHLPSGTLECMSVGVAKRTRLFALSTDEEFTPARASLPAAADENEARTRYGLSPTDIFAEWEMLDPVRFAEKLLYQAKRVLTRDKNHQRMMFMRDGQGTWFLRGLLARDRTEKHLIMRTIAQLVESRGCDAIVEVGEMWSAPQESLPQLETKNIEDLKERGELLFVMVITREGFSRTYLTPFTRGPFKGIKMGTTRQVDGQFPHYLEPVLRVWRKHIVPRHPTGNAVPHLWAPDSLDVCYCGGPKRFGECCQRHIPRKSQPDELRTQFRAAMHSRQFERAEQLARASLAQYVIWIKRHTVVTMHVAPDLHRRLVDIDALALEELVNLLEDSLQANGHGDSFVPQVRQLASIIGLPRVSMRLVAMASRWLLNSDRIEEAILELDSLGDFDEVDLNNVEDALTLIMVADLFDISVDRKRQLLQRALIVAATNEEESVAKTHLAELLMNSGDMKEALSLVDSIIVESGRSTDPEKVPPELWLLRWKITRNAEDLDSFMKSVGPLASLFRQRYATMLIDESLHSEAEQLLANDAEKGSAIAKLMIVDSRIRAGKEQSARELFLELDGKDIPEREEYTYAVISGQVSLSCKDEAIRRLAILNLKGLSVSGTKARITQELLTALQRVEFS